MTSQRRRKFSGAGEKRKSPAGGMVYIGTRGGGKHTRRKALLQLIRLIQILEHEGIQEAMTSDFEFDLLRFAISFDAGRCEVLVIVS